MRGRIDYLDGLRAIAVLAVVMIHYGGFGLASFGVVGNSIVDHGKYGVTIFFVLSAYSLCLSIARHNPNWPDFYIRRFFRIAPLYWVVCVSIVLVRAWNAGNHGELVVSLVSHLTMANIFDLKHANDLIRVEWSIPVEVSFYILFPVIFLLTVRAPLLILILGLTLSVPQLRDAIYLSMLPFSMSLYEYRLYTLPWHLSAFLAGMLAYFWLPRVTLNPAVVIVAMLAPLSYICVAGEGAWSSNAVIALTVLLLYLCQQSSLAQQIVGCRPLTFIGRISFSIYLIHYVIGPMLVDPYLSLAVTLALSTLTYLLVEQPAQRFGQQLIAARQMRLQRMHADG